MISAHVPNLSGLPADFIKPNYSAPNLDRKNPYLARTGNLKFSFSDKLKLKQILNDLLHERGNGIGSFDQLSSDSCRDILEKLHDEVGEDFHLQLKQAGFDTVSDWSCYFNSRAGDKLNALKNFLEFAPVEMLSEFSPFELRMISRQLSTINLIQDLEVIIKDTQYSPLIVKQSYLYDIPQVSLHLYDNALSFIISEVTLQEVKSEIDSLLKSSQASKYQDNAPIVKLTGEKMRQEVKKFESIITDLDWKKAEEPPESEKAKNLYHDDCQSPKRTVQKYWNDKISDTRLIAKCILSLNLKDNECYVYRVNDFPVGMMVLNLHEIPGYLHLKYLLSHPGSEGCGGAMIEYAVNRSNSLGKNGQVWLDALIDAQPAYRAMGFVDADTEIAMSLNPASSANLDKWSKNEQGKWKLKKHMDKRYMTNAFEEAGVKLK